jgi:hypothetical protein
MAQPRKGTGEQLSEMLRCRPWPAVATVNSTLNILASKS